MADAEAQAPEVGGAQLRGDVAQTVVAGVAAALLQAHLTRVDVELVVRDEDLLGRDLVVLRGGLHGAAGVVHEREGLQEPNLTLAHADAAHFRLELALFAHDGAFAARERVDEAEPGVVTGARVFGAGVPEPHDQTDCLRHDLPEGGMEWTRYFSGGDRGRPG